MNVNDIKELLAMGFFIVVGLGLLVIIMRMIK